MKAIILARVSHKKQDSNEAQLIRITDYIKFKDLTVVKTHEIEESSTRGDRRKFQEVIREIKQSKECIALVVDTVDRLQRSFKESVLLDDLRKAGKIEIHFYRENLVIHKNSNSADLLRWDMAVMFARSYILQLSDNVKRKLDQKRKDGEWSGRAPTGYKNTGIDRKKDVIPDSEKAHLIQRLFQLYATGTYSVRELSIKMSEEGLRNEVGKPIAPSLVYKILNTTFYYGEMRCAGVLYPHKHMPLISKDLFMACQRVQKGWHKKKFQYAAKPFALRGLLQCARCGCTMSPETKKGKYTYYSCTNARKAICNKKTFVREEALLQPVIEALKACSNLSEDTIVEIIDLLKNSNERDTNDQVEADRTLAAEYDTIIQKQNRLTDLFLEGTIAKEAYESKLKELKDRKDEINQLVDSRAEQVENTHITAAIVLRLAKNAHELLKSSEPLEKRALLNFALQNSKVSGKNLEFTMTSPFYTIYDMAIHPRGLGQIDAFRNLDWQQVRVDLEKYQEAVAPKDDELDIPC